MKTINQTEELLRLLKMGVNNHIEAIQKRDKTAPKELIQAWSAVVTTSSNKDRNKALESFAHGLISDIGNKELSQVKFTDAQKAAAERYAFGILALEAFDDKKRAETKRLDRADVVIGLKAQVLEQILKMNLDGEFSKFDKNLRTPTFKGTIDDNFMPDNIESKLEAILTTSEKIVNNVMKNFKPKGTVSEKDRESLREQLIDFTETRLEGEILTSDEKRLVATSRMVSRSEAEEVARKQAEQERQEKIANYPLNKYKDEIEKICGQLALIDTDHVRNYRIYQATEEFVKEHDLVQRAKKSGISAAGEGYYSATKEAIDMWHEIFEKRVNEIRQAKYDAEHPPIELVAIDENTAKLIEREQLTKEEQLLDVLTEQAVVEAGDTKTDAEKALIVQKKTNELASALGANPRDLVTFRHFLEHEVEMKDLSYGKNGRPFIYDENGNPIGEQLNEDTFYGYAPADNEGVEPILKQDPDEDAEPVKPAKPKKVAKILGRVTLAAVIVASLATFVGVGLTGKRMETQSPDSGDAPFNFFTDTEVQDAAIDRVCETQSKNKTDYTYNVATDSTYKISVELTALLDAKVGKYEIQLKEDDCKDKDSTLKAIKNAYVKDVTPIEGQSVTQGEIETTVEGVVGEDVRGTFVDGNTVWGAAEDTLYELTMTGDKDVSEMTQEELASALASAQKEEHNLFSEDELSGYTSSFGNYNKYLENAKSKIVGATSVEFGEDHVDTQSKGSKGTTVTLYTLGWDDEGNLVGVTETEGKTVYAQKDADNDLVVSALLTLANTHGGNITTKTVNGVTYGYGKIPSATLTLGGKE